MTHNEILMALAAGKQLEVNYGANPWYDTSIVEVLERVGSEIQFGRTIYRYRVRPEPKPDIVLWGCIGDCWSEFFDKDKQEHDNVQAIINGETGKLKSVRVLGKPCPEKMEAFLRKCVAKWDKYPATQHEINEVLKP